MKSKHKRPTQLRIKHVSSYTEFELQVLGALKRPVPDVDGEAWSAESLGHALWGVWKRALPASAVLRKLQSQGLVQSVPGSPIRWKLTSKGNELYQEI